MDTEIRRIRSVLADWGYRLGRDDDQLLPTTAAYDNASRQHAPDLTVAEQDKIARLVTDLPAVWDDPATPMRERKRITRLLITDVTVTRRRHAVGARCEPLCSCSTGNTDPG